MLYANILLLGAAQGLFLVWLLLRMPSAHATPLRLLAALTFCFSLDLWVNYCGVTGVIAQYPRLLFVEVLVVFLYGPLLYLYVRTLSDPRSQRLSRIDYLHFLPFAAAGLLLVPALLLEADALRSVLAGQVSVGEFLPRWVWVIRLIDLLPRVLIGLYLLLGVLRIVRHGRFIRDRFSEISAISLRWLRNLLGGIATLYVLYILAFAIGDPGRVERLLNVLTAILVYALGYRGLRQPALFTDARQPGVSAPAAAEAEQSVPPPRRKYAGSALDARSAGLLLAEVETLMREERVYLEPRLTLAELASRLGVPSNYLSQAINQQAGCNFHDYINGYRIEAAKVALAEPTNSDHSILTIAMDAGFHSKSAFYATFKEFVGMTPSEYRRRAGS